MQGFSFLTRIISSSILFLIAFNVFATQYVPIRVGDITIIIPIDEAPIAVDDLSGWQVAEDESTVLDILGNDVDEQLSSIESECAIQPFINCVELSGIDNFQAQVSFSDGVVQFLGAENWHGTATFDYRLYDEKGQGSELANVSVVVTPVADAPIPYRDGYEDIAGQDRIIEVEARKWHEIDLLWNDVDPDNTGGITFVYVKKAGEANGLYPWATIEMTTDKKHLRFYSEEFDTFAVIDYEIQNADGGRGANWVSARINVIESSEPNQLPIATDVNGIIQEDVVYCNSANYAEYQCALELDVLANVNDPDGSNSNIEIEGIDPSVGTATLQTGRIPTSSGSYFSYDGHTDLGILSITNDKLYYRPKAEFYDDVLGGEDRFGLFVKDERGAIVEQVVTVKLNPVAAPAPPQNFIASANIINLHDPVTTSWSDTKTPTQFYFMSAVTPCMRLDEPCSPPIIGRVTGSSRTTELTQTGLYTYKLKICDEVSDLCSSEVTTLVTVNSSSSSDSVLWTKASVFAGEVATLTWDLPGSTACHFSETPNSILSSTGSQDVTFYESGIQSKTIECTKNGQSVTHSPTIQVNKLTKPSGLGAVQ